MSSTRISYGKLFLLEATLEHMDDNPDESLIKLQKAMLLRLCLQRMKPMLTNLPQLSFTSLF